ncbi:hypothetical protein GCM10011416_20000 [Polaribacter pacificus]|uniref:DUF6249 domain-containing protein n=1 Tax=Polaribacter pacificus TaxID=1775173 RepID=A0A917MGQ9_9FLAO|nr:DUF6249 domain-containing protein [Polaribacter pacificus]GGH01299.1 hypothetical protein GCM10011416_20000 [Polaribacter pacificus]
MDAVVVLAVIFGTIFGVFYLFFSTRNKERLALIEKGVDAKIFMSGERKKGSSTFAKVFILNLALLAMGIGVGILIGSFLNYYFGYSGPWGDRPSNYIDGDIFYTASIFLSAGAALFIGFTMTKKMDNE